MEAALPDEAWFQRLARNQVDSSLSVLRERFPGFEGVDSPFEFEKGIEAEELSFVETVSTLIDDERARIFIRAGHDFDNLIQAWKAQKMGGAPVFDARGLVGPEVLEEAVKTGETVDLPGYLGSVLEMLRDGADSSAAAHLQQVAEAMKWSFLRETAPSGEALHYIKLKIDLTNIKTFLRLKTTKLRGELPEGYWIEGGEMDLSRLDGLLKEPEEAFFGFLQTTDYRGLLKRGLEKGIPSWRAETIISLYLIELLNEYSYAFFGIGPVLYHMELRGLDMKILRSIISSKLNNLPEEMILEKVEALVS